MDMGPSRTLAQHLLAPDHHQCLVDDCTRLVERRIARQGTMRRLMFKAAIAVLNAIKANAVRHIVIDMLPRFAYALEPLFVQFRASDIEQFSDFLLNHRESVATALLSATDTRVQSYGNSTVIAIYGRLRHSAEQEIELALPELAQVLGRHLARSTVP